MDTRRLEYFVAVAEELSITGAASRLGVAGSTLSAGIRTLERELGGELLRRLGRGVVLSDAGVAALPAVLAALRALGDAGDAVADSGSGRRGVVRFGMDPGLGVDGLAGLLGRFCAGDAGANVETTVSAVPGGSFGGLIDGRLDLALVRLVDRPPPGVRVVPVVIDRLCLVAPEDHPIAAEVVVRGAQLAGLPVVALGAAHPIRVAADRLLAGLGVHRATSCEVADVADVLDLVAAGFGVAVLPAGRVPDGRGLTRVPIRTADAAWVVGLARSPRMSDAGAAARLFDVLSDGLLR